mmetsp:Transcript_1608/g.3403  ORF Transcript_1608/g.3403 Transcript_1608/m.3403 type:complete len:483 (-) Transcript_1608:94-1542(-)
MPIPSRPNGRRGLRDRTPPLPPPPTLTVEETVAGLVLAQHLFGEKPSSVAGQRPGRLREPPPSAQSPRMKASDFRGYESLDELLGAQPVTRRDSEAVLRDRAESSSSSSSQMETAPNFLPSAVQAPTLGAGAGSVSLGLTSKLFGKVAANMPLAKTKPTEGASAIGSPETGVISVGVGLSGKNVGTLSGLAATVKLRNWTTGAKQTVQEAEGCQNKGRRRSRTSSSAMGGHGTPQEEELDDNDVAHDLDNMLTGVGLSMKTAGMPEGWEAMLALIDAEVDPVAGKRGMFGGRPKMKVTINRIAQVASWRAAQAVEDPEVEAILRQTLADTHLPGQVGEEFDLSSSLKDKSSISVLPGCYTAIEERTQDVLDKASGVRGLPMGEYKLHYLKANIPKPAWQKKLSLPASVLAEQAVPQGPVPGQDSSPTSKKPGDEVNFPESEEDTETAKILEDQNRQYLAWRRRVIDCTRNLSTEANRFHFVD